MLPFFAEYEPIRNTSNSQELLNENKDETICRIFGYTDNSTYTFLYHLFGILLVGLPYLIIKIYPKLGTIKYEKCVLDRATILLGEVMIYVCFFLLFTFWHFLFSQMSPVP